MQKWTPRSQASSSTRAADIPAVELFSRALQKCRRGKALSSNAQRLHAHICNLGLEMHRALGHLVVPMLVECGRVPQAQQAFHRLVHRKENTWTSLILGQIQYGRLQYALTLCRRMGEDVPRPSRYVLMALLKASAKLKDAEAGRETHAEIARDGLDTDAFVGSSLVDMYAKCGLLSEARSVFDRLPIHDAVAWTALLAGYAEHGPGQEALKCFEQMQLNGIPPDAVTFVCVVKACGSIGDLDKGREIHKKIEEKGFQRNQILGNSLVHMYAKCGSLTEARHVFSKLPVQDVVSWSTLIAGYVEHGAGREALKCFEQFMLAGLSPDAVTFICLLKACGSVGAIDKGRELHREIRQRGFDMDVSVGSSLVDMYVKCGLLSEAQGAFDNLPARNVVSWNALLAGYAEHGPGHEALKCYEQMQLDGVSPDAFTFACILKSCGNIRAIAKGREIHNKIMEKGLENDLHVQNTLISMYAKFGLFLEAVQAFNKMPVRNIVSWNALIAGYAEHGSVEEAKKCVEQMQSEGLSPDIVSWSALIAAFAEHGPVQEALTYFDRMQLEGVSPNALTYVSALKACGSIGAIDRGREIHNVIVQNRSDTDLILGNTLIDMYAKSGSMSEALCVFEKLPVRDVVSWNTLINGYGINRDGDMAVQCFKDMQGSNVKPNVVTFTCLLIACARACLAANGQKYFRLMQDKYGFIPMKDHYICMVDLLAQSGSLYEAESFLEAMPWPPCIEAWTALLSGCKIFGQTELGLRCFEQLVRMNPENSVPYVFMINIYASAGKMDHAIRIDELRKLAGAKKKPANALIELNMKAYEFIVGNNESKEISAMLEILNSHMKEEGYMPNLVLAPRPMMSDKEKEVTLCNHAEKLAVAFGLLNSSRGQALHLTKNMKMCSNCHNANAIISKIEKREIIVRDSYSIHHFKDGICSCTSLL